jgi:putative FmdB family regulatory protein
VYSSRRLTIIKKLRKGIKMPLYDFECEPCAYYSEIRQRMRDPSILECPICGEQTLRKVFINPPHTFVRGDTKTVGQLAEKNYKNMGFYEKQDRKIKDSVNEQLNAEKNDKRKQHQKIISMTPEQQMKWIREGD